jgi:transketolase
MSMRRRFQELLTEEMKTNSDIVLLVGDVGYKVFDHLREEFPNRVINPGAAEQLMIGMGVGFALEGKIPVCYSITPFVLYRPFEFIRNYLHHEQIPVKLVGSGRNDDYGPCGFSHYACEDLKVLEALSGIDVHYPQSSEDVDIKSFLYSNKPSYINLRR